MSGGNDPSGRSRAASRILVFSTNTISDPGIDLAGSSHMHYPPTVLTISLPCASGIRPGWLLHAVKSGFDGIFIASDGVECAYLPDCAERSARIVTQGQELLRTHGLEPQRIRLGAICSVCAESFVTYVKEFSEALARLGPARLALA